MLFVLVLRNNKTSYIEKTITFNEDEVKITYSLGTSVFKWKMIQKIKQSKKYIFMYTSASGGYIIPKNIFATSDEVNNFYNYLSDNVKANR